MESRKRIDTKFVYETRWLRIREDHFLMPNGTKGVYSYVERPNSVIIIPLTPSRSTVLLKQYRYPTDSFSWELPMGGLEPEETPDEGALRELLEEVQLTPQSLVKIGVYHSVPGLTSQKVTVFVALVSDNDLDAVFAQEDVDDILETQVVTVEDAYLRIAEGKITDGFTLVGFMYLRLYLDTHK